MFKRLVQDFLLRYLGEYVYGFNPNKLKLWKGEVNFRNFTLKQKFFSWLPHEISTATHPISGAVVGALRGLITAPNRPGQLGGWIEQEFGGQLLLWGSFGRYQPTAQESGSTGTGCGLG